LRLPHVPTSFESSRVLARAAVAGVLFCAPARAERADVVLELTLRAPAECGSADGIESTVAGLVRSRPQRPVRAELTIWDVNGEYTAELRTEPAQRRTMRAATCQGIVEAATVILALAIDPIAEPPSAGPPASPEAPRDGSGADAPDEAPAAPRIAFFLGARPVVIDTSVLPHVSAGGSVHAGLTAGAWLGALEFTYWLPASTSVEAAPPLGGRFTWWTVAISGCIAPMARSTLLDGTLDGRRARLSLCVAPELGRLEGQGRGATPNRSASATWFGAAVGPQLAVPLSAHVALQASAGLALTILGSHPFVLERSAGSREVHRPARFSGRGGLGLDVLF
jgi:hypothetical protein